MKIATIGNEKLSAILLKTTRSIYLGWETFPERLRGRGDIYEGYNMNVKSSHIPYITKVNVYLPGSDRQGDGRLLDIPHQENLLGIKQIIKTYSKTLLDNWSLGSVYPQRATRFTDLHTSAVVFQRRCTVGYWKGTSSSEGRLAICTEEDSISSAYGYYEHLVRRFRREYK